jgi:hypothetical protein
MIFLFISTYALSSTVLPVVQKTRVPVVLLNIQPVANRAHGCVLPCGHHLLQPSQGSEDHMSPRKNLEFPYPFTYLKEGDVMHLGIAAWANNNKPLRKRCVSSVS